MLSPKGKAVLSVWLEKEGQALRMALVGQPCLISSTALCCLGDIHMSRKETSQNNPDGTKQLVVFQRNAGTYSRVHGLRAQTYFI